MQFYGEVAALLTAFCWSFNSIVFSEAGKKVSSLTVNRTRLYMALIILIFFNFFVYSKFIPSGVPFKNAIFLGLSGIVGYIIGDSFLFESFLLVGPRISMLIMLSTPIFGSMLAWIFLGEKLSEKDIIAILITISGIALVVGEKRENKSFFKKGKYLYGIGFAVIGAVSQATGLLLSKFGLEGGVSTVSANFVRVGVAAIFYFLLSLLTGALIKDFKKINNNKTAGLQIFLGAATGPVIGVILSLEAINHTSIGIASTLMSLSPIILIPVSHYLYGEKITVYSVLGTVIAIFGSSLFFI